VLNNGGQFQIILGAGIVDAVYKEFAKIFFKLKMKRFKNDVLYIINFKY